MTQVKTKECRYKGHDGDRNVPLEKFYKDKNQPDGLNPWCRDCVFKYQSSRRAMMNKSRNQWRARKRMERQDREQFQQYLEEVRTKADTMVSMVKDYPDGSLEGMAKLRRQITLAGWEEQFRPLVLALDNVLDKDKPEEDVAIEIKFVVESLISTIKSKISSADHATKKS